ncbi:hypothetical protein JCGZ_03825 [Jatropha curcas]|uniref:Uncharacterized protein n=1 Tax=Jatropha curcas TaxID=180498 RepID=A0A067JA84_JATCU|nr:hypothetical protein JCGZ_03825 [Jatropha curcas]
MPPRYKRSRPASSVAAGHRSSRSSTASPPSDSPPLPPFETSSPEQGTSTVSNDEVLARILSRMDVFDTRLNNMESMIADRFQSIELTQGSLDSRLDTLQGHYQGLSTQLQTVIQLLQPPPPPPET